MTKNEWDASNDPAAMMHHYLNCMGRRDGYHQISDRKLRLFCAAHYRLCWGMGLDESTKGYVKRSPWLYWERGQADLLDEGDDGHDGGCPMRNAMACAIHPPDHVDKTKVAGLIREIGGDPWTRRGREDADGVVRWEGCDFVDSFVRPAIARQYGSYFLVVRNCWLTPDVLRLAEALWEEGYGAQTYALADALEEAGCDETRLPDHLRSKELHVRGCWAVELVLGKEFE